MKKKGIRWYILWFVTSGMWLITFCSNFIHSALPNWLIIIQFLNIVVSFVVGIVNLNRYKKRYSDEDDI